VIGVRSKYPPVVDLVRRTLRDRANPGALRSAGQPGDPHGVIVHTGRRSGRSFRTPVTPVPAGDGFVIALPYGHADWVRNVLAAGAATIVLDGAEYPVDRPQVEPLAAHNEHFGSADRFGTWLFGVEDCLTVRRASQS